MILLTTLLFFVFFSVLLGGTASDEDGDVMQLTRAGLGASDSDVDSADDGLGTYHPYDENEKTPPGVEPQEEEGWW